jgi:broad specificity phosphatase PhoE
MNVEGSARCDHTEDNHNNVTNNIVMNPTSRACCTVERSTISIELAKKESNEHMIGLDVVYQVMRHRPFLFQAYNDMMTMNNRNEHFDRIVSESTNMKTIHLIRHGQGYHNLIADIAKRNNVSWTNFKASSGNPYMMNEVFDPPLTHLGRQQALLLQQQQQQQRQQNNRISSSSSSNVDMIIVSPLCRTLQTTMLIYEKEIVQNNIPCLAHELVREEMGIHLCDYRRSKHQ